MKFWIFLVPSFSIFSISGFSWYLLYYNCNAGFSSHLLFCYSIFFPNFSWYPAFWYLLSVFCFLGSPGTLLSVMQYLMFNFPRIFLYLYYFMDSFILSYLFVTACLFFSASPWYFLFLEFKSLCHFADNHSFFNEHLLALLALKVQWTYIHCILKLRVSGLTFQRKPHSIVKHTQTIRCQQSTNCLSAFGYFVGLAFKGWSIIINWPYTIFFTIRIK